MTPPETIRYLEDGGFFGARVVGTDELVFLQNGEVVIQIGENDRILTVEQFEAQYTGARFRKVQPTERGT